MYTIKNYGKLFDYLRSETNIALLDAGAQLHRRHSNITYKVISADDKAVVIQVQQEKSQAANYASKKDLIKLTKELFQRFLPTHKINVHATEYKEHPATIVDATWLTKKMAAHDMRIKDLETDIGIQKSKLSAWANGLRPMSYHVQAMFYYYFLAKGD